MEITYLLNSGFIVKLKRSLLVFDDFNDPARSVDEEIARGDFDNLYFFASHAHFDHFDPHILKYQESVTRYIFSNDIRRTVRAKAFPAEKVSYLKKYDAYSDENIEVTSYDSTDVGTSFAVETEGKRIFHAGDFNWWDWDGEEAKLRKSAKLAFFRQMEKLEGLTFDVVFFPVDGRLGNSAEKGAKEFLRLTDTKALIAMHRVGYPKWEPKDEFFVKEKIFTWSPIEAGESVELEEG
ncbi:MAG: MBL fold metallo-hydrolase [Selenomonadaceae bacterium]|nr:MBL fold metallo-hydrolase [Selenomonadaceae bacterium]